jgi:hypothetical protein
MRKFLIGLLCGVIFATAGIALAEQPIKLIVNGTEIQCDVPPQVINGRTMVPARFLAEALGARVEWDETRNAVVVSGGVQVGAKPGDLPDTQLTNPTSTDNINNKEEYQMDWMSLRDLVEKYNIEVLVSESEIIIRGNGKEVKFDRQIKSNWQTTKNSISLKSQNGICYIVESQIRQAGIIN